MGSGRVKGPGYFLRRSDRHTTRDELGDVQALKIEGRLNGEVMHHQTRQDIFKIGYLISYLSQGIP